MEIAQDDERLMSLVDLALAQPSGEREAYLRSACGDNSVLFEQAWHYVQWDERMGNFLRDSLYSLEVFDVVFEPGQLLLDGRFQIVRKVGEGGMGIVYEAVDNQVNQRVAIKCAKTGFRKRLPPEVRHAREIAHSNVCKIFDIHKTPTERGEVDFVVMEFLEGETLTDRRLREGALPEKEARAVARQLAAGLAAAHRSGVIHGDLKSNNVILTKAADGSPRAVITDFGLAKGAEGILASAKADGLGVSGGAPDYMAPELWKGQNATVATDIYAFGVMLYEMLTGTRLQSPQAPWEERLTRKPPKVHSRWDGILGRCLDPDPALRYPSVAEIEAALEEPDRRWIWAIAAAVVLAAVTGVLAHFVSVTPPETVRLAMLPFETDAGNRALSYGLVNETADRLRRVKNNGKIRLTVIPLADAVQSKVDQPEKADRLLGATHVLKGAFHWDGGRVTVRASLSSVHSQVPIQEWQTEYAARDLRSVPINLAATVAQTLHLPALPAAATVNPAAYSDYTSGIGLLQRDDAAGALPPLERAVTADPDSPLTHAALAHAKLLEYQITNESKWLDAAIASFGDARRRNPDDPGVLLVSSMIHESLGEYELARDDLARILDLEPQNGDALRRLGMLYEVNNRFADALGRLQKALETEPGHIKNYQALCYLYSDMGNSEEGLPACQKMVALASDSVWAHLAFGSAYWSWGDYAKDEEQSQLALGLNPSSSLAFHTLAVAEMYQGKYDAAIKNFQQALRGDPATHLLYLNLGMAYRWNKQREEYRKAYTEGVRLAKEELARNSRDASVRSELAYMLAWLNEREEATRQADWALTQSRESASVNRFVIMTYEVLGETDHALQLAEVAPRETIRSLSLEPDMAALRANRRFQVLMGSHNIH